MKKQLAIVLSCFLFGSLALADVSAKDLMKQVNKKFAAATKFSVYDKPNKLKADQIDLIKKLRKDAESSLKSGNEEDSKKILDEALKILG